MNKHLLLIALLTALNILLRAQEFTTGVYGGAIPWENPYRYDLMKEMGAKSIVHHADKDNNYNSAIKQIPNMITYNAYYENRNWINYYASGYWSQWEAEENVAVTEKYPGIRRQFGTTGSNNGVNYVTTGDNSSYANTVFLEGPYYNQDRKYRLFYDTNVITYVLSINAKRGGRINLLESTEVFRIDLYYKNGSGNYRQLSSKVFNEADISTAFEEDTVKYSLPVELFESINELRLKGGSPVVRPAGTAEIEEPYGFYFKITWSGNYELFIDKVEVYDDVIGRITRSNPLLVAFNINKEATTLPGNNLYPEIKYWYGLDEPQSIDNYLPYKIVDSILWNSVQKHLITAFYPNWDGKRNHEWTIKRFMETAQPHRLMYDYYPYFYNWNGVDYTDEYCLELQRNLMQHPFTITNDIPPIGDYYYVAQAFGWDPWCDIDAAYQSRKPNPSQLRATVMLALSHGTKGIFFWPFYSFITPPSKCGNQLLVDAIVSLSNAPTDIYHEIKNNLFARLNSTLGNTLANLDYTGNSIQHRFFLPTENPPPVTNDYLTIGLGEQSIHDMNWHVGFLEDKVNSYDNKYFLMANLITNTTKTIQVKVTPPVPNFVNYRFRDVEPEHNFDVTFTDHSIQTFTYPAGEGRLFQVAPVVKYGGKLIADEHITQPLTLNDDMIIENGATLYVSSTYTAKGNITIKSGGKIVSSDNGIISFINGKGLIIEGSAQVYGTVNDRLKLNYTNTSFAGVKINQNGSLLISYCDIEGSAYGIMSESGIRSANIENVNFKNCQGAGVALLGSLGNNDEERTSTIKNCSITNCGYGVYAVNFNEIVIMLNTITNCRLGIVALRTLAAHIIGNYITTTQTEYSGIMLVTSNGNIRDNTVRGHTNGIALAYSSPNIGGNTLEGNSEHGLYVSIGSIPNLQYGKIGNPVKFLSTLGYNIIRENGVDENLVASDGSEIYIREANILLDHGCNQILDDRPSSEPRLLMNGSNDGNTRSIDARYNYWGTVEPSSQRFGGLTVIYEPFNPVPYYGPCQVPPIACEELLTRTSKGELIAEVEVKNCDPQQLSELELKYAEADMLYLTGEVNEAKTAYQ